MATLVAGKVFGATETVTNTKLGQLVNSATINSIVRADFNLASDAPVNIGASEPSNATAGHVWYDSANSVLRVHDGTKFQLVAGGQIYTNSSGGTITAGAIVVLDTSAAQSVKTTTTANDAEAWGIAVSTANDTEDILIVTQGIALVATVTGSTNIGDFLSTSTTAGKADPSPSFTNSAIARALTTSATAVVVQVGALGAASSSAETFEMEADREATVSTTFGTPTVVTFDTEFAEPPIVICTAESTNAAATVGTIQVTKAGFTAWGSAAVPFNWVAVTAGTFEIKSGVFIQAGTASNNTASLGSLHAYQTGKTPSIVGSMSQSDDVDGGFARFAIFNRMFGGEIGANLNFAGRSSDISVFTDANIAGHATAFILISQTSTVKTGSATTADGAQDTINTLSFECGTVVEVGSLTPGITFQTAFSAAPAVILSGESRSDVLAGGFFAACLNTVPTTTVITARLSTTDTRTGYNWIAFEKGHTTVAAARRVA